MADIHGNAPALSAVLADAERQGVDTFLLAGDYIFDLPFGNEVCALLRGLENAAIIAGNKEGYLPGLAGQDPKSWTHEQMGALYEAFRTLLPDNFHYLSALPKEATVGLGFSRRAYVTHFIPIFHAGEDKILCESSSFRRKMEERPFSRAEYLADRQMFLQRNSIRAAVSEIDANAVVVAHSHLQWHGTCEGRLVINPGSCGQPLDFAPGAPYTILHSTQEGLSIEERRVPYDIEGTIKKAKNTSVTRAGRLWCELVFLAMRTGRDYFSEYFAIAHAISDEKGETGELFANETWCEAGKRFFGGDFARILSD